MSHSYAWPSQQGAAGAPAPDGPQDIATADLGAALALAALPQAFDLAVTGLAALAVFPAAFFSGLPPGAALAAALALWGLAYAVAAVVARWPADRRRPWTGKAAARAGLTVATVAISLLPAVGHAAWAPAGLVVARLVQGLAIGRLGAGLPAHAGPGLRALAWRTWGLALLAGGGLAAALAGGLALSLGRADLLDWGWRFAFFIALALNLAAFAADLALRRASEGRPATPSQRPRLATVDGVRVA
ncbi:hypothetical protein ACO2Q3_04795 [Caulobacter sp. KR2-114]|uniref:hypothetical protein n=1 Tax=Caulobacter sp. KR2-114 TaxID=3400912 RepID=UPI003C071C87